MHLQAEGVGFLGLKVNMLVHHHSFIPKQSAQKAAKKAVKSAARKKTRPRI
jgi:hypothetical protein